jgi:uncharacterized membrane protein YkvA (DUF1232 family)
MTLWQQGLLGIGILLLIYVLFVAALYIAGRRTEARALAGFIPDSIVLFRRLLGDPRIPKGRKFLILALIGYLTMPIDLVPDFIPVAGQLDDVILVALVLRRVLRGGGPQVVREHWLGPEDSLRVILRLAYGRPGVA